MPDTSYEVRRMFDEAIGSPPATGVDVAAVMARGRRRSRLHRLAGFGAGATALAVLTVCGVLVAQGLTAPAGGPNAEGFGQQAAAEPSPSPTASVPEPGVAPFREDETTEQAEARIVATLTDSLNTALPGVQLSNHSGKAGIDLYTMPDGTGYNAGIVIETAAGIGEATFESLSVPAPTWTGSACTPLDPPQWLTCTEEAGLHGEKVIAVSDANSLTVFVYWTNARLSLSLFNATKTGEPDTSTTALLTTDQLIAIADDPELTVTTGLTPTETAAVNGLPVIDET